MYVVSTVGTVWMSECDSEENGVLRHKEKKEGFAVLERNLSYPALTAAC